MAMLRSRRSSGTAAARASRAALAAIAAAKAAAAQRRERPQPTAATAARTRRSSCRLGLGADRPPDSRSLRADLEPDHSHLPAFLLRPVRIKA